jgi:eukaryotic-like serine/threonine-protein kinase
MDQEIVNRLLDSLPQLNIGPKLGKGGQKIVHYGTHPQWGNVVIKLTTPENENERERALREIAFVAKLNSPLFASPFYFGEFTHNGQNIVYVIEEFLIGKNLREIINSIRPNVLPITEVHRIILNILEALSLLQAESLVHRDIKPENIMISESRVTLIDFGIARKLDIESLTATYEIFGPMTPGYAPPEQIKNEKRKISFRTDLFSLGVVVYELLIGKNPFLENAKSPQEAIWNVLNKTPIPLANKGFNSSMDEFVMRCLNKTCHKRPESVNRARELFESIKWEV